ncbi:restriction endonuclease subunit S [Cloacibacterium normanense]|uniref:Restriction endonuclease subunit S n=1 Tax=Cloacibacterium normanense TaxID=237258 RepID=A0A2S7I434_9FLAO|nr:restriction endonuclease subunit S [Cloacibacterium normanense]PPZ91313.1 restriction endonuclease subunit S [Cloacibacterium normanense]
MAKENKSVKNFPNLRFPGFEGEWRFTNLGNCAYSFEYGMNASAIKFDGENRYIRITDIDEASSKYKPEFPVSPNGQLLDKYLVSENDILFARTGASTGKSYLYHKDDGKLYFAGFLIRAKIKEEFNSYFVFTQTKTIHYYKWVQLMSMRSGQPGINLQEYACYSFHIPSKKEQDKIASFLLFVDERIQTQKKIIEDTRKMKLNLLHNLFTQNFRISKQYISKWEEKTLGDISAILMGQSPDSSAYNTDEKGLPLIQGNADIVHRFSEPRQFTNQITKTCDIGDIILTVRAPVGYVAKSKHFACIGRGVCAIKSNEKSDSEFIYQFLLYFENKWSSFEQGSTFTSVNSSDIKTIKINVPAIEEQREIAQFLKTFDEKINLETELLAQYENQKKYLLQNLFV